MELLSAVLMVFFVSSSCVVVESTTKVVRLHWYMHDTPYNGINSSSIPVTAFNFSDIQNEFKNKLIGQIYVFDDPLTQGASLTSASFGRAQGTYTYTSRDEFVAYVSYTVSIRSGQHNGSTLNILGAPYPVSSSIQHYAIVGGTGDFMLARGILKEELVNLFGPFGASATSSYHATVYLDLSEQTVI